MWIYIRPEFTTCNVVKTIRFSIFELAESRRSRLERVEMKRRYTFVYMQSVQTGSQETCVDVHVKTWGEQTRWRLTSSTSDQRRHVYTRYKPLNWIQLGLFTSLENKTIYHIWFSHTKDIKDRNTLVKVTQMFLEQSFHRLEGEASWADLGPLTCWVKAWWVQAWAPWGSV